MSKKQNSLYLGSFSFLKEKIWSQYLKPDFFLIIQI